MNPPIKQLIFLYLQKNKTKQKSLPNQPNNKTQNQANKKPNQPKKVKRKDVVICSNINSTYLDLEKNLYSQNRQALSVEFPMIKQTT